MKKFKTTLALLMALGLCVGSVPANTTYTKAVEKTLTVKAVSINLK